MLFLVFSISRITSSYFNKVVFLSDILYRNTSNKRPGCLLNFPVFRDCVNSEWTLYRQILEVLEYVKQENVSSAYARRAEQPTI